VLEVRWQQFGGLAKLEILQSVVSLVEYPVFARKSGRHIHQLLLRSSLALEQASDPFVDSLPAAANLPLFRLVLVKVMMVAFERRNSGGSLLQPRR
jgi:hypothetical protein